MSNLNKNLNDSYNNGFDNKLEQRKLYDHWETYTQDICEEAGWVGPVKVTDYVIEKFADRTLEVADLGCGPGPVGEILKEAGYVNVDGYDLTEHFVSKAKQFYRDATVIDITQEEFPKKYDIILASGVFTKGHLSSAPAETIVKSLNENGVLIITTPNMEDYNYMEESGWNKQQFLTEVECIGPWPSLVTDNQHYHYLRIFKAK
jgi:2-polyprenyl-3-methyl-5-hydroxy-6-metoxy-1,4-benzoquinol methylase